MDRISVIIISYNRPFETIKAIESVLIQEDENNILNEIIVINNCSSSDYSDVENFISRTNRINLRYFKSDVNLGVAGGRNLGVRLAKNEGLLFIDDDAVFENKEIVKTISLLMKENEDVGILAFLSKNYYTREININEFPHHNKNYLNKKEFYTSHYIGVAHYIKKNVFDSVGYYPEDFFYGMEEYDLSYKAINKGFKILYSKKLVVYHKKDQKGRQSNTFIVRKLSENKIKVAMRNLPKKYVLSHFILWSLKYLKESKGDILMLIKMYISLYNYSKKVDRKIVSKRTIKYIKSLRCHYLY